MAINPLFDSMYYLVHNPDVRHALGMDEEAAWQHYQSFGAAEGRMPNAWFDAAYYASQNPDLARAGLGPADLLNHFQAFGAAEARAPHANVTEATWLAYAHAPENADLRQAFDIADGAESLTAGQLRDLSGHYFHYGIHEGREGAPVLTTTGEVFMLTPARDAFTGSLRHDVFNAFELDPATGQPATTLNSADVLDGGGGLDELNIFSTEVANPFLSEHTQIRNIDLVNIVNLGGEPFHTDHGQIDAGRFEGSNIINQVYQATDIVNLAEGVTAAFSDISAMGIRIGTELLIQAADTAEYAWVHLNNVGSANLRVQGPSLSSLYVDDGPGGLGFLLSLHIQAGEEVDTFVLDSSVPTAIESLAGSSLTTLDATATTQSFYIGLEGAFDMEPEWEAITTILTGSGDDNIRVNDYLANAVNELTIDTGAGDDTVTLEKSVFDRDLALDIQLGEGDDLVYLPDPDTDLTRLSASDAHIDGGSGSNGVQLDGSVLGSAADYDFFNTVLTNFQQVSFLGLAEGAGTGGIRADWLDHYDSFFFLYGGHLAYLGHHQSATTAADLWVHGHDVVNVSVIMQATVTVEAPAANITVEGTQARVVSADDTLQDLSINLQPLVFLDNPPIPAAATLDSRDVAATSQLAIRGQGQADVHNQADTALVFVDAQAMDDGSLNYLTSNPLAETIILGEARDTVTIQAGASPYQDGDGSDSFDVIRHFDFDGDQGDTLIVADLDAKHGPVQNMQVLDASGLTELEQALQAAAQTSQAGTVAAIFEFEDNTWVFVDSGSQTQALDADDTVVKLAGTFDDLEALAAALMDAAAV